MSTPQVLMTKARIATFLSKLKAIQAARARSGLELERTMATTIRYQRGNPLERRISPTDDRPRG